MSTTTVLSDQHVVEADTFIAAPPARVFQALTDPEQTKQWWGQKGMYRVTSSVSDLRPGGKWRSEGVGDDGTRFDVGGEYREVNPPHEFVYTWQCSWMPGVNTLVRVKLEAEGSGTRVRIHHSGFTDPKAAQDHGNGWVRVLGWMQGYVERNETVETRPVPKA